MRVEDSWIGEIVEQAGGWISFERFMAEALYHPEFGYYSSSVRRVGKSGDFSTSATLCPAFAEAIARWANARLRDEFAGAEVALIEVGAGGGDLAANLRAAQITLGLLTPDYYAVEPSPPLQEVLRERVEGLGVAICNTVPEALASCGGQALVFSNELVDAFPARQLVWQEGDWREIVVEARDGALAEAAIPFTDPVDAEAPAKPGDGERIFIHPRYYRWMAENLAAWRTGAMLTIDYGSKQPAREARGYRAHDRKGADSLYAAPGQQDLTCDVNFRDLQRWGEGLGWTTAGLEPQFDFLERWLPHCEQRAAQDEALQFLRNPMGAGGAFQVLEQQR